MSLGSLLWLCCCAAPAPAGAPPRITVDQFGYLPTATKIAVLREPVNGFDAPSPYTPSAELVVRRVADGGVVFRGQPQPWHGGEVHAQSGDRCWWLDFSAVREPGEYEVVDPAAGATSGAFAVGPGVYLPVLRAAVRVFFYQRCGCPKAAEHAGQDWVDAAPCHLGPEQDAECRPVSGEGPTLDLRGGWHDAGDYNKYINFSDDPVHNLLLAFEEHPGLWPDDWGIPESGNGVPDLLDELRYQLDWFLRMQLPDGSVIHKVSVTDYGAGSPPSADHNPRRYAPPTASATVSACGVFAHAARVFAAQPQNALKTYAARLARASGAAWNWLGTHREAVPSRFDNAGFRNAAAEDDEYTQRLNRIVAAVYLFAMSGDSRYRRIVDEGYRAAHLFEWSWAGPWEANLHNALLYYAALPGATPAVAAEIRRVWTTSLTGDGSLGQVLAGVDAYRAPLSDQDHVWGSSSVRATLGTMYLQAIDQKTVPGRASELRDAAAGYLHYLHGVNPLGLVYLSNAASLGAERSVREFYHGWFGDGTPWDQLAAGGLGPPPGFVPGGPNSHFQPDGQYAGPRLAPPLDQPPQKCYRDWNTSWPENSWEITENSNGYQAAYVRLLAAFAAGDG